MRLTIDITETGNEHVAIDERMFMEEIAIPHVSKGMDRGLNAGKIIDGNGNIVGDWTFEP